MCTACVRNVAPKNRPIDPLTKCSGLSNGGKPMDMTVLMMVAAFAGHDFIKRAYDEAIKEGYKFYSYGDAMLII
jgi:hypothetical protein